MPQSDFNDNTWESKASPKKPGPWCLEHETEINRMLEDNKELWKYHDLNRDLLEKHKEDISGLKNTVYGIDGGNGLRGKSKEFQIFVDKITPDHAKLMEKLEEFHNMKRSFTKVIWILVATALISLVTNWTKIQSDEAKVQTLQNIQSEVSKILQDKLKNSGFNP